jgi:hypothetical protein
MDEACARTIIHTRFFSRHEARSLPYIDELIHCVNEHLGVLCALIVEDCWPAILRLAPMLKEHLDLTGEEAEMLLTGEGW